MTILKRYIYLALSSAVISNCLHAQTIEIIRQSSHMLPKKYTGFDMIEPDTDTTKFTFVAVIKATGKNKYLKVQDLFYKIETRAHELGANGFKLHKFQAGDSLQPMTLVLDVYACSDVVLNLNTVHHEKNVVYILSNNRNTATKFKINGVKKTLAENTYYKHANRKEEDVTISKGGAKGISMQVKWEQDKPAMFITLAGFGLGEAQAPDGAVGVSLTAGRFNHIAEDLGRLLVLLYKPVE